MQGFVCALQDWSHCFPESCGSSIIKSLWPSRSDSLGFPSPVVRTPGWKPDVGFRTSQPWKNFCGIIVFQFVGHPPGRYGICFYRNFVLTILLRLVLCLCMGAMFFGGFQCPPVDGCSTPSCDFGALTGEDECTAFHSAILNHKPFLPPLCLVGFMCSQEATCRGLTPCSSDWSSSRGMAAPAPQLSGFAIQEGGRGCAVPLWQLFGL